MLDVTIVTEGRNEDRTRILHGRIRNFPNCECFSKIYFCKLQHFTPLWPVNNSMYAVLSQQENNKYFLKNNAACPW